MGRSCRGLAILLIYAGLSGPVWAGGYERVYDARVRQTVQPGSIAKTTPKPGWIQKLGGGLRNFFREPSLKKDAVGVENGVGTATHHTRNNQ